MMAAEYLVDIDRETGEWIRGWPRIRQSLKVIATTRLRTRLMRLWWGSEFTNLQDKPGNEEEFISSIVALLAAFNAYEPEFKTTAVIMQNMDSTGSPTITVYGDDLIEKQARKIMVDP